MRPASGMPGHEDAQLFVDSWGLDADSVAVLENLPPSALQEVLAGFAPKPGTKDVNGLFRKYAASIHRAAMPENELQPFVDAWGLDAASVAVLEQLPSSALQEVVSGFAPKPDTKDVNGLFRKYAESIHAATVQTALGRAEKPCKEQRHFETKTAAARRTASLQGFVDKWGLDEASVDILMELAPTAMEEVLKGFAPKPGTKDVNGLFQKYALSIHKFQVENDNVQSFVDHWGLDASSVAVLEQLAPETLQEVLAGFAPKPGTKDYNGLFKKYAESIHRASATSFVSARAFPAGKGPNGYSVGKGRMATPPTPEGHRGYIVQKGRTAAPSTEGHRSYSVGKGPAATPCSDSIQTFVDSWGLDAWSATSLRRLPAAILQEVLQGFAPKPETKDVNGLFKKYVESIINFHNNNPQVRNWGNPVSKRPRWS
eukprot:TRINITY_DN5274_c0_g1_i1.p1 TRINITY_DN5274_c0_g1~~TRINITY_DN5274_c0_g1_i1.p1  ORF type:complete len:428 (-),score=74.69 TRINITY_DN5274_c0_g1_i1:81-1364(-)